MDEITEKLFIELIKKNSPLDKIRTVINELKAKGNCEFMNKYYSEKRTALICEI